MASASSTKPTERVWRWNGKPPEPQPLPESWAVESKTADSPSDVRFYAIKCAAGRQLRWTVDQTGTIIEGPHSERIGIELLFARDDGQRAFTKIIDGAYQTGSELQTTPNPQHFQAVEYLPADAGDPVENPSTPQGSG